MRIQSVCQHGFTNFHHLNTKLKTIQASIPIFSHSPQGRYQSVGLSTSLYLLSRVLVPYGYGVPASIIPVLLLQKLILIIIQQTPNMKDGTSFLRPPTEPRINIDLQLNLFNTWLKYEVAEYYQNLFLTFLDEQSAETVEKEIRREIKQTIEKSTMFFRIENLEGERQKQIGTLEGMLGAKDKGNDAEIVTICEQVSKLRNINLEIAQALLKIYEKFRCSNNDSQQKQGPYFQTYFDALDKQNSFIKESILRNYIKFDDGYDPFLMEPYEKYHRSTPDQQEAVKNLYNLNISYVYRLIRTKNAILEIRSKLKQMTSRNEKGIIGQKLYKLRERKEQKDYESKPGKKEIQEHVAYQKRQTKPQAENHIAYQRRQTRHQEMPERRQSYSQSNKPIKIAPIKVYPSSRPRSKMSLQPVSHDYRVKSPAYAEKNYQLVFSRVSQADSLQNYDQIGNKNSRYRKHSRVYLPTEPNQYESISKVSRPSNKFRRYPEQDEISNNLSLSIKPRKLQPIHACKYDDEPLRESPINKLTTDSSIDMQYQKKQPRPRLEIVKEFQIKEAVKPTVQTQIQSKQPNQALMTKGQKQKPRQAFGYDGEGYEIKHYNPIKKNQFQLVKKSKASKYDFVTAGSKKTVQYSVDDEESDNSGLMYERPIFKYSKKCDYNPKKKAITQQSGPIQERPLKRLTTKEPQQRRTQKTVTKVERVQQQCQTLQDPKPQPKYTPETNQPIRQTNTNALPQTNQPSKQANTTPTTKTNQTTIQGNPNPSSQTNQPQKQNNTSSKATNNNQTIKQNPNQPIPKATTNETIKQNPERTNQNPKMDQTLQNSLIIDQRKSPQQTTQQPPIRTVPKKQSSPQKTAQENPKADQISQIQPKSTENNNASGRRQAQKKEIKMKVGKSTLAEVLSLLKTSPIKPQHKTLFGLQRLIELIKVNQTYLTQFHLNNVCAIIALSSPIPGIGMALKLWTPIHPAIDQTMSNNLFLKYIQHMEKSTTSEKIMFSGNGEAFKELKNAEFNMKKENLYERTRKSPAKQIQMEFKPFLFVQCSTVNFNQNGNETMLFSEEIEQFNDTNCHFSPFIAKIDKKAIPKALQPLVKISENINNFEEVNKVLTAQNFDNYQAGDIKITSINLLRLHSNTHFKGNFVACEGHFQFMGNVHYQKEEESVVSIQTSKNNGVLYFGKKMSIKSMLQKCKIPSNTKSKICVKMFHKTLYGKIPKQKGCYANWQINLTWQDEMQGKVKHPLPQGLTFGSQGFCIGVQFQKEMLYCAQIRKEDFIY